MGRRRTIMSVLVAAWLLAVAFTLYKLSHRSLERTFDATAQPTGDSGTAASATVAPAAAAARADADQEPSPDSPDAQPLPEPAVLPGEISVLSLLGQMTRLDHLARAFDPAFATREQSSTDRRARTPADPDTWFANDDFITNTQPNLVRVEALPDGGKRYVLLDAEGPGAVVRLWTASPAGTLRIFVDGQQHPALQAKMQTLLAGQVPPFDSPLGQVTAMGYTLYFPFPYRKRCLITLDSIVSVDPFSGKPIDKVYYQVWYRTYRAADAAHVRSYSPDELNRARGAIRRVVDELRRGGHTEPTSPRAPRTALEIANTTLDGQHRATLTVPAPPGAGGGQLTALRLFSTERDAAKLRSTWVTIAFDDEETVRAPLTDLFGTGPGFNPYMSLPLGVGADGWMYCRFPMPFRRRAVLNIFRKEPGGGPLDVAGVVTVDARRFERDSLLFHARWRPTEVLRTRPFRDWHVATLTGTGHLVGTVLDVENPPGAAWWGEGDEKIYVDGETFPGIFGTGTEDYFGYAWSSGELFAHPYHAQTRATGPGFSGQFSMNRFHILDPVPFQKSLRFDIEAWHWNDTSMTLDATLFWYARPGGSDDFSTPTPTIGPTPASRHGTSPDSSAADGGQL